jgi:hypothetical protein
MINSRQTREKEGLIVWEMTRNDIIPSNSRHGLRRFSLAKDNLQLPMPSDSWGFVSPDDNLLYVKIAGLVNVSLYQLPTSYDDNDDEEK